MSTCETTLSVVVWANVLDVNRYLGDIANIALCIPDVADAVHAEQPDEVAIDSREFGPAIRPCHLDHTPMRTDWQIAGPVAYSGTILCFGDASISQLRSTMRVEAADPIAVVALVHVLFLRGLAERIESDRQHARGISVTPSARAAALGSTGAARVAG
jgi:hypothetical protein